MSGLARIAASSSTIRRSRSTTSTSLLITHEHVDHNGAEAIAGEPAILRSTAGKLESPIGEVIAVASEHDDAAGTERGPNTIFAFDLDGVRVAHFGDFGQRELRPEQAAALGGRGPALPPGRRRPHDRRRPQRPTIVETLRPRWVVPMHYRTPRIGFLETEEEFVGLMPRGRAASASAFDTTELPDSDGTLVVVPAAP